MGSSRYFSRLSFFRVLPNFSIFSVECLFLPPTPFPVYDHIILLICIYGHFELKMDILNNIMQRLWKNNGPPWLCYCCCFCWRSLLLVWWQLNQFCEISIYCMRPRKPTQWAWRSLNNWIHSISLNALKRCLPPFAERCPVARAAHCRGSAFRLSVSQESDLRAFRGLFWSCTQPCIHAWSARCPQVFWSFSKPMWTFFS